MPATAAKPEAAAAVEPTEFFKVAELWLRSVSPSVSPRTIANRKVSILALARRPEFQKPLAEVAAIDAELWAAERCAAHRDSYIAERAVLVHAFDYAVAHAFMSDNPAKNIAKASPRRRKAVCPEPDEYRAILADMRAHPGRPGGADAVEFYATTGCRRDEAWECRRFDIEWAKRRLHIRGTKSEPADRYLPFNPALEQLLKQLTARPGKPADRLLRCRDPKKGIHAACARLGIRRYSAHKFRHLFASQCLLQGVPTPVASEWIGHSDGGKLLLKTCAHVLAGMSEEWSSKLRL